MRKVLYKIGVFIGNFIINFYRFFIRPLFRPVCRFEPTCSEYTKQAIKKYGLGKGFLLGIRRISKCRPFSKTPPYDPVP